MKEVLSMRNKSLNENEKIKIREITKFCPHVYFVIILTHIRIFQYIKYRK